MRFLKRFRRRVRKLTSHPLTKRRKLRTLGRYLGYHATRRLKGGPRAYPFVNDLKLLGESSESVSGATGNIFTGLHDFEAMGFLLHFLRPGDVFLDAGANVGVYSLLAAAIGCRAVAVEPVPETFRRLEANVQVNGLSVETHNCGLGSEPGVLNMTTHRGAMNRIVGREDVGTVEVRIQTVDELMETPTLWKLDVEGFELEVLKGASQTLADRTLQGIIVELNGSGQRFGSSDDQVHHTLLGYEFMPVLYEPFSRSLRTVSDYNREGSNTIYARDVAKARQRTASGEQFRVFGDII